MKTIGQTPSIALGETARVYRLQPLEKIHICRCYPKGIGVAFSFFAKVDFGSDNLRVALEGPFSSQTTDFIVKDRWERFEIPMKNNISLCPLNVYFTSQFAIRRHSDIAFAFPQIEEGLFATSPIGPDIELPAIADERSGSGSGSTRAADRLWLDKEKMGVAIDSNSATAILVGTPIPEANQIMETDFFTFLSFWSSQPPVEVSIGISGRHNSRFVVRERTRDRENFTVSNVIAGRDLYFVCAIFDNNQLCVVVNGAIAIVMQVAQQFVFDRTYLGCSHGENANSLSGHIRQYMQYTTPLVYPQILNLYQELCPEKSEYTYDYMMRYFRYSLATDSEIETIDACLEDEGFSYLVQQINFAIPEIFDQFPPGRPFREEDVRDWAMAIMKQPGVRSSRENYSKIGRTDLLLSYLFVLKGDLKKLVERNYRIEFKIWGRAGYKDAPSQPLKYMSESEIVGAFVMIDRRKTPDIRDFEEYVKLNTEFPCMSIKEIPILENNLRYFCSFHKDKRYRMARMMINIYLPIAE